MLNVEVLKFGSSVLRSAGDLHVAVDEIYRRWRSGSRVFAVVSAFEGVTDRLMAEVAEDLGSDCPEATAAYVATGEVQTAALLMGSLRQYGLPARLVSPREIGLTAVGTILESSPVRIDRIALKRLWNVYPILVLPGFYGVNTEGETVLFGRGGSDLSALFLAAELGASCRLQKDVSGVFDTDPARSSAAHRFAALSWSKAIEVAGPLIQPKALHYASTRALPFEVGRPNEAGGTTIGHTQDAWAPPTGTSQPLRIALIGCGVVGRGVYETLKRYPRVFEVRHVVVREIDRYPDIEHLTINPEAVLDPLVNVVVVCFGGTVLAYPLIVASLSAGKFVVTANKAAVAAHGMDLVSYARGHNRRLWYSAAVGGALPAIETLTRLESPVNEIRGIINGTCGVVLDAMAEGVTCYDAISLAQKNGFAEANVARDLSGLDSADKLALMIEAGFGAIVGPEQIPKRGIDTIQGDPAGYKLIARATRTSQGISASVQPEVPPAGSFLSEATGPENRLEIELATGEVIRLRAQGAGRWPTTASIMGDLHEIARLVESGPGVSDQALAPPDALRHTKGES
jgi:homoserine dehydrogenase